MRRVATVFGGAGFIGRAIVQRLAKQDFVVRVVTRNPDRVRDLKTAGFVGQIVPLAADPTEDAGVARAVEGAEAVINLIGILYERRAGDFERLQAEAPGRIARASAAAGVAHLVHLSAIGADAASESVYARTKAAGEAAVRAGFPAATILRPSIVFGPEDAFFNRFAQMATLLPFMPVVSGDTRFQPVFVGDVADAVMAALAQAEAAGQLFELGGPRVWTFRELMAFILETTRRRRRLVDMPMGLMRFQARIAEKLPAPPITSDQLLLLQKDNVVAEGAATLADLGIAAKAVEAVVPAYLARFRPGGGRRDTAPG
jgi:uncharacterized protein YbjT (DUF2867 family)